MNVSDLYPFQIKASTQIADRFRRYMEDPLTITRTKIVPFYQNLHALTGAGKTVILADTIEQLRSVLPVEPIVLWLSKGKVVVEQTYANLSGGKYAELLGGYTVKPLRECAPDDIENAAIGLVLVATVGKFNQKDKEQGDRKIFQVELDNADKSLWDLLKFRHDGSERRRPFIVVYDEGHKTWVDSGEAQGERADLHGADLAGANLRSADLQGAALHGVKVIQLGPLGSRHDYLVVKQFADGNTEAMTGCFQGDLSQLETTVQQTHADHPHYLAEYTAALAYCRAVFAEEGA